jgi:hypothetical protein
MLGNFGFRILCFKVEKEMKNAFEISINRRDIKQELEQNH